MILIKAYPTVIDFKKKTNCEVILTCSGSTMSSVIDCPSLAFSTSSVIKNSTSTSVGFGFLGRPGFRRGVFLPSTAKLIS